MRWRIFAVGKPKLDFARDGTREYAERLRRFVPVATEYVKAGTRETESAALLERSQGCHRIALEPAGEEITSAALAQRVTGWEGSRIKEVALLIGGADGHTAGLRSQADWSWSLSKLTLQHELALLLALEQLYRAYTIKARLPYHRE